MNELIKTSARKEFRWTLLATVSVLALVNVTYAGDARADGDDDHPVVWIELGGQLERLDGEQVPFSPPFFDSVTKAGFESPLTAARPAIYSNGAEGSISFTPENSDWVFSGSVRYGRSESHRFLHQQTPGQVTRFLAPFNKYLTKTAPPQYAETKADNSQSHFIADFQAGKDFGLGMFGNGSTSVVSLGARFAQFAGKSDIVVHARPDVHFTDVAILGEEVPLTELHQYFASAQRSSSFHGFGPSISWDASTLIADNSQFGKITLDWGAKAAVLFGRQKAVAHHQSSGSYYYREGKYPHTAATPPHPANSDRSHTVVVPNLGGFAGASFLYSNAKVSVGYRADFFFGAMDGGIDTAKKENVGFYGPFASVSVGIGG